MYIFIIKKNYTDIHLHHILCSKLQMHLNRSHIVKWSDGNNICTDLNISLSFPFSLSLSLYLSLPARNIFLFFISVVVMCANATTIREILLAAEELGMVDSGEYVFFSIELSSR